jgi:hypothetical protein
MCGHFILYPFSDLPIKDVTSDTQAVRREKG